ncbi:2-oxoglutarate dehydrogenase E1 component [Klebsormidium nitens]|uniref:2-oxoglutarate dehydrogenase E1 component n=1 Tax=Klebsormidium nitens TaxID=105231 RepID=A0A1Y1I6L4_KLENI|nr:2-oxoglutarate dehydrogenase E1 component [Klebsormidium nitens]|eukprot:GAQ84781.1 2-oxoglutarate dehydrogenase E1 component [Klebsormidium nitens]
MSVPRIGTQGVLQSIWKLHGRRFHRSTSQAHPAKGGASSTHGVPGEAQAGPQPPQDIRHISQTLKLVTLIRAFRSRGHFAATLDPLGRTLGPLTEGDGDANIGKPVNAEDLHRLMKNYPRLDLSAVGLKGVDLRTRYFLGDQLRIAKAAQLFWTVPEIVALMRASYCGTLTVEYEHVNTKEQKEWVRSMVERPVNRSFFSPSEKRLILRRLLYTDQLERFFATKFPSAKRFGIEGCESLMAGLFALAERAAQSGVENIELGMAHRGRLNVLHHFLRKPLGAMISEFMGGRAKYLQVGDVKYHLGTRGELEFGGKKIAVSLSPNPSHLEAVDAVVVGKTKAKQFFKNDVKQEKVLGLLLHGDAAFCGLGLPVEVMQLSDLPEYTTGGTIHVILNNQIGFTTDPKLARSSPHPSDVAKGVGAPIFHVNGDDPEAVVRVCQLAVDWRQRFKRDVVVDLVCYRRHGHNEQDDPRVTQPLTSKIIASHPSTYQLYLQRALAEKWVTQEVVDAWTAEFTSAFESEYAAAAAYIPAPQEWLASNWQGDALGGAGESRSVVPTGLPLETLKQVGLAISEPPPDFDLHPDVARLLAARRRMVESERGVDWATAEALAFGSLLVHPNAALGQTAATNPAHHVRLSGQDCERGTFNQRHAVLYDQTTAKRYVPLNHIAPGQQELFKVCNSSLSEAAVLGFEYGFSLENESALVLWEAQFGDFSNNAQLIIDTFITSGEEKWATPTGLVLLLPHGFDGQGPDHSSGYLERFLQLANDDPDHLPGLGPAHRAEMEAGFAAADTSGRGYVTQADLLAFMRKFRGVTSEKAEVLMQELDIPKANRLHKDDWNLVMAQWLRRNAEKDHNLCVINASTPSQIFHALRRQVNRYFSKPLICMAPKYLLHHRACTSSLADMATGAYFRRLIADGDTADNVGLAPDFMPKEKVRRVILCSGKVYYLLAHARRGRGVKDVALLRLEQIAPFPFDRVAKRISQYPNAELCWVQEEPKNRGAWTYVQPRIATALRDLLPEPQSGHHLEQSKSSVGREVRYIGRSPSASAATGAFDIHTLEVKEIIEEALA